MTKITLDGIIVRLWIGLAAGILFHFSGYIEVPTTPKTGFNEFQFGGALLIFQSIWLIHLTQRLKKQMKKSEVINGASCNKP